MTAGLWLKTLQFVKHNALRRSSIGSARMAAVVAMVDGLPLDEQPSAAGLTGRLAAALSRLGRGLMRKECESAERSESGSSC